MSYKIEWLHFGVEMNYSGVVTDADIINSNNEVYSSNDFKQLKYEIVNFDQTIEFELSDSAIRTVAFFDIEASKKNETIQVAVIGNESISKALTSIYQSYSNESLWKTKYFNSKNDALQWLQ